MKPKRKNSSQPGVIQEVAPQLPQRTRNPELQLLRSQWNQVNARLQKSQWALDVLTKEKTRIEASINDLTQPQLPIS